MTVIANPPFPSYFDVDGSPLDNGYIYFGVANQNPETNPITVYWDAAYSQPAAQPIRTSGGFAMRNGTPAAVYVNADYSVTVRDKNKRVVYSKLSSDWQTDPNLSAANIRYYPFGADAVASTVQNKLREYVSVCDFGAVIGGDSTTALQAAINSLPNGGTILIPGNITLSSPITFSGMAGFAVPLRIVGIGAYGTTITVTHSGKAFDARSSNFQALMLENLRITGPGKTAAGSIGIDSNFGYGYLDRVSLSLFETGIDLRTSNLARARQLNIINCGIGISGVNASPSANILFLDQSWISFCTTAIKVDQFGTVAIRQTYVEQNGTSLDIRSTLQVRLEDVYSEAESLYGLYGYDIYPVIKNCRFVTKTPYIEFSVAPPLYGWTYEDGLRLGSTVDWSYNYNTVTKTYDVAYTDFTFGGTKYRCIGNSTSTSDAYETIDSSGKLKYPKQPLAIATMTGATANDKTGDSTLYTVIFDSETVDQAGNYDPTTGIFTAPVAGRYRVDATINLANLGAAHTLGQMAIAVGATNYYTEINPGAARTSANRCTQSISMIVNAAASAQIKITIAVLNGTKTVGIGASSYLSIHLIA